MPKLKEDEVVEQWSVLIEGAQGKGSEFYQMIKDRLAELNPPALDVSAKDLYSSFIKRLQGDKKTFLLIQSKNFNGYILNVCAQNYGNQLLIAWYLIQRPSKLSQFLDKLPDLLLTVLLPLWLFLRLIEKIVIRKVLLEKMDIFDRLELTAFATTIHHAVTHASELIGNTVGFDFSKVDLHSRGFLNIT
jgi:hypothetical protein